MSASSVVGYASMLVFFGGAELNRHGYRVGCWMGALGFLGMIASMLMWAFLHVRIV